MPRYWEPWPGKRTRTFRAIDEVTGESVSRIPANLGGAQANGAESTNPDAIPSKQGACHVGYAALRNAECN